MLLDLFLRERTAGRWPVSRSLAHFHEIAGPSFYRRIDVHVERAAYAAAKSRLLVGAHRPSAGRGRGAAHRPDPGPRDERRLKFFTADGSWLLVRTSGTEPLVRVYTEATSAEARDALVEAGERLVREA